MAAFLASQFKQVLLCLALVPELGGIFSIRGLVGKLRI